MIYKDLNIACSNHIKLTYFEVLKNTFLDFDQY